MHALALAFALWPAPLAAQPVHDRCWELTHQVDLTQCRDVAFDELVGCLASPDGNVRYEVIRAFDRPGVLERKDFMTAVLPAGRKAVSLVPRDPDLSVRYASGSLANDLTTSENKMNPYRPPPPARPGPGTVALDWVLRLSFWAILLAPVGVRLYKRIPRPPPEMRGKL